MYFRARALRTRSGHGPRLRAHDCMSSAAGLRHEAPPGGVRGPAPGRRDGRVKLRGSLMPEVRWRAGAAPDDRATVRRQRAGCGCKAEGIGDKPVLEAPILDSSPETGC